MAVLGRDDFLSKIKGRLGEELSDEDIAFMEDMTDTYDNFDSRIKENGDWKAKYEENDKAWREKYIERFTGATDSGTDFVENPSGADTDEAEETEYIGMLSYEDLFKEGVN